MSEMSFRVVGAEKLGQLGADLKAAGDKELRKELFRACQRMARPISEAIRDAFRRELPGQLGSWVADAMVIRRRLRTIGKGAGVRFLAKRPKVDGEADLSALDRGRGKHPTFGRSPWVVQAAGMRAGIVRRVEESKVTREAVEEFTQALDRIAESLAGRG
ncbi:MAG: hypothetical protein A2135_10055 [Actinobacteria bacterium RBG_16_67_15]|nr:MAG: hypothetical protein A2135_10055 [Actinobacteria bacterium RBG_16_67_15]